MGIRSGRFKVNGSTEIIKGVNRPRASYRIFNSGGSPITVTAGNPNDAIVLWPACSADVVAGTVTVSATSASEGIYEYLEVSNPIRGGRFSFQNAAANDITIVQGKSRVFYRILNSGEQSFVIKPKGALTPANDQITLEATFSVDVTAADDIVITGEAGKAVEGVYEYLDSQLPVRSGRFKITQSPQNQHKIIDLSGGGSKAWYRIFNSGDHTIVLEEGSEKRAELLRAPRELVRLGIEQSFDFEVGTSVSEIFVKSTDSSQSIEGIYEFIGREN